MLNEKNLENEFEEDEISSLFSQFKIREKLNYYKI